MSNQQLTADEVTLSLTNTIMNLQGQLESARKEYIDKMKKSQEAIKEKQTEIDDLKEKLVTIKKKKEDEF